MRFVGKCTASFLIVSIVAGCSVSRVKSVNYLPEAANREKEFYRCYNDGQRFYSTNSGSSGSKIDNETVKHCMAAQGYNLRSMSGGETVFSLLTFPLMLSFMLLGTEADFF